MAFSDKVVRLRRAVDTSYAELEPFRRHRREAISQYVGHNYSDYGAPAKVPVNYIEIAVQTYSRMMISSTPQVRASTVHASLKPAASELSLALNQFAKKMELLEVLKRAVLDAIFSIGIVKIGLDSHEDSDLKSGSDYYTLPVPISNFFFDVNANDFRSVQFAGDRYRKSLEYVQTHPEYDENAKNQVLTSSRSRQVRQHFEESAEDLSTGPKDFEESLEPMVELEDIYLPGDGLVVTMEVDGDSDPLWIRPWDGPDRGMYRYLCYEIVPENAMPLAPVALWKDIHTLSNELFRKLGRQAGRQKTVLLVQGAHAADGDRIVHVNDGESLSVQSPDSAREIRFGGPDERNMQFFMQLRNLFNLSSGNVEMLGGIAPTSDTLGQDKMLSQNAGQRVANMSDETLKFTQNIYEDLAWWMWEDPFIELPLIQRIPGTKIEVPITFNQESKDGNFLQYNFDIVPHSMRSLTPGEKISMIDMLVTQVIIPMLPMLQEQGVIFDFEAYLKLQAEMRNIPELNDLVHFTVPRHPEPGPVKPMKSPTSERRYVRENVSRGMTSNAMDQQMAMKMAGSGGGGRENGRAG